MIDTWRFASLGCLIWTLMYRWPCYISKNTSLAPFKRSIYSLLSMCAVFPASCLKLSHCDVSLPSLHLAVLSLSLSHLSCSQPSGLKSVLFCSLLFESQRWISRSTFYWLLMDLTHLWFNKTLRSLFGEICEIPMCSCCVCWSRRHGTQWVWKKCLSSLWGLYEIVRGL